MDSAFQEINSIILTGRILGTAKKLTAKLKRKLSILKYVKSEYTAY